MLESTIKQIIINMKVAEEGDHTKKNRNNVKRPFGFRLLKISKLHPDLKTAHNNFKNSRSSTEFYFFDRMNDTSDDKSLVSCEDMVVEAPATTDKAPPEYLPYDLIPVTSKVKRKKALIIPNDLELIDDLIFEAASSICSLKRELAEAMRTLELMKNAYHLELKRRRQDVPDFKVKSTWRRLEVLQDDSPRLVHTPAGLFWSQPPGHNGASKSL